MVKKDDSHGITIDQVEDSEERTLESQLADEKMANQVAECEIESFRSANADLQIENRKLKSDNKKLRDQLKNRLAKKEAVFDVEGAQVSFDIKTVLGLIERISKLEKEVRQLRGQKGKDEQRGSTKILLEMDVQTAPYCDNNKLVTKALLDHLMENYHPFEWGTDLDSSTPYSSAIIAITPKDPKEN